jgi:hypothetical protein
MVFTCWKWYSPGDVISLIVYVIKQLQTFLYQWIWVFIDLQNQYWPQPSASVNIILQVNKNSYSLLQKSVIVYCKTNIDRSWSLKASVNIILQVNKNSYLLLQKSVIVYCQPEGDCFSPPRALVWGKTLSRGLTTWCSPHMKAITVLLYRNYPKMFIAWMFCLQ